MTRQKAEKITTEYLNRIFGFALKRCKTLQDAEDLSQEIVTKVFQTLLKRDDIENVEKFIWTIAHNSLSNYYRDNKHGFTGVSIDEISEILADSRADFATDIESCDTVKKMQSEIAYLSKLQRRILVAYYYHNMKQGEIAEMLNIPVGTVKWHLFEAKKELKRGMETMRTSGELKFNPIKLKYISISGTPGKNGNSADLLTGALAQNIIYSVFRQAKTIAEIAEELGVSPVYIESEVESLEEYGYLSEKNGKYLCQVLLSEQSEKINRLENEMYKNAADIFANEVYDKLQKSGVLDDENTVFCNRIAEIKDGKPVFEKDKNFMLWALIPYILACGGDVSSQYEIKFEDVATIRPDGAHNITSAVVVNPNIATQRYPTDLNNWFGPCWSSDDNTLLWQIDSKWSAKRWNDTEYLINVDRIRTLLHQFLKGEKLSSAEYAMLSEKGFLRVLDNENGFFSSLQTVWVRGQKGKDALMKIGEEVREKHRDTLTEIAKPYIEAVLADTPEHLRKVQAFGLQYLFSSSGIFILYCIKNLLLSGKLILPTEEQRKSLTTVIVHE